jgi:hypothetical protein
MKRQRKLRHRRKGHHVSVVIVVIGDSIRRGRGRTGFCAAAFALTASIALVFARAISLDTGGSDTMSSSSLAADAAAAAVVVVGPPPPPLFFFFDGMCGGLVGGSV